MLNDRRKCVTIYNKLKECKNHIIYVNIVLLCQQNVIMIW